MERPTRNPPHIEWIETPTLPLSIYAQTCVLTHNLSSRNQLSCLCGQNIIQMTMLNSLAPTQYTPVGQDSGNVNHDDSTATHYVKG